LATLQGETVRGAGGDAAAATGGGGGLTFEEMVKKRLDQVPEQLEWAGLADRFPASYTESLNTVLCLEVRTARVLCHFWNYILL
jgi:hypothetical protein